jgi:hypothetical protein
VTTLQANSQVEIHFEETISHSGAPFRIALSYDDDTHFDELILQDHIPHNDLSGTWTDTNTKKYSYKITIPDVTCDTCTLQMINPMTDKISTGACCSYPKSGGGYSQCSSVYHSCANIKIQGGSKPLKELAKTYKYNGVCGAYTQEPATYKSDTYGYSLVNTNPISFTNKCTGFQLNCQTSTPPAETSTSNATTTRQQLTTFNIGVTIILLYCIVLMYL